MRRLVLLAFIAVVAVAGVGPVHADLDGDWSLVIQTSNGAVSVKAVDTDASGNIFIAGDFQGSVRVAGGPLMTSSPTTKRDVFVAKLSPTGSHLWSTSGGGTDGDFVQDIAVGPAGTVGIVGLTLSPSFAFGGAAIANHGQTDGFAASFASTGAHNYTRVLGGTFVDFVNSVAFDSSNTMYVAGQFRNEADFGTGRTISAGLSDFFLLQFTLWGSTSASLGFGGTGDETLPTIDIGSSGTISFAGQYTGSTNLGNGSLSSNGGTDMVVAQFPSVGVAAGWSASYGGTGNDSPGGIVTHDNDNLFVCGLFNGTVSFGSAVYTSDGGSDGFVAGYKGAGAGAPLWSRRYGGIENDWGNRIALDGTQLFVTGEYRDEADFGPQSVTAQTGGSDGFLLEIDTSGNWECVLPNRSSQDNFAADVAMAGQPVVVGNFFSTASWGTLGMGTFLGGFGEYVVKMKDGGTVSAGDPPALPNGLALGPAYPNPLRTGSRVSFRLPGDRSLESARILDVTGRSVRTLAPSAAESGALVWDGRDEAGRRVASGVYFLHISDGETTLQERVTVVR